MRGCIHAYFPVRSWHHPPFRKLQTLCVYHIMSGALRMLLLICIYILDCPTRPTSSNTIPCPNLKANSRSPTSTLPLLCNLHPRGFARPESRVEVPGCQCHGQACLSFIRLMAPRVHPRCFCNFPSRVHGYRHMRLQSHSSSLSRLRPRIVVHPHSHSRSCAMRGPITPFAFMIMNTQPARNGGVLIPKNFRTTLFRSSFALDSTSAARWFFFLMCGLLCSLGLIFCPYVLMSFICSLSHFVTALPSLL